MIICAAIKLTTKCDMLYGNMELVICGHRHGDCYKTIAHLNDTWRKANGKDCITEGFINHKGEFLDRKEALAHALECGQLSETHKYYQEDHNINELYSEDLY